MQTVASLPESPASSAKSLSYAMSEVYLGVDRTLQSSAVSLTGQRKHANMLNSYLPLLVFMMTGTVQYASVPVQYGRICLETPPLQKDPLPILFLVSSSLDLLEPQRAFH